MTDLEPGRADKLRNYKKRIGEATADKNEAVSTLGGIYKDLDDKGFNKKAVKLAINCTNMEPANFRAFHESYLEACTAFGLFDQKDMFLDAQARTVEVKSAPATTRDPDLGKTEVTEKPAKAKTKPKGEKADELGTTDAKEAGKRAGLAGKEKDQNPNPSGSLDAQMWDAGWTEGHQSLVDAAARANPGNRRRKLTEEGTVAPPPPAGGLAGAELSGLPH